MRVKVCAAVVMAEGKVLVCSRPPASSHSSFWEFPGGKMEEGESVSLCLEREMMEELGAEVMVMDCMYSSAYSYPGKDVEIFFFRAFIKDGESIRPQEGQEARWCGLSELRDLRIIPADIEFVGFLLSGVNIQ